MSYRGAKSFPAAVAAAAVANWPAEPLVSGRIFVLWPML